MPKPWQNSVNLNFGGFLPESDFIADKDAEAPYD
jgi:hypothetical protein